MHSFNRVPSIIGLSHSALGNPLPAVFSVDSNFLSDDTALFNDVETSNANYFSIPMVGFNAKALDFTDSTSMQSPDTSWLTDPSALPPDTADLFAIPSDTPLETSFFSSFPMLFWRALVEELAANPNPFSSESTVLSVRTRPKLIRYLRKCPI